jgi:glycosyltransferase 2 family protein
MAAPSPLEAEFSPEASLKAQMKRGAGYRLFVSLLLAVGFVWLLSRGGLPLVPSREDLAQVPIWAGLAFALLNVLSNLVRSHRWASVLRPVAPTLQTKRVVGVGLIGYGAIFFAPLRLGEAVRPLLISQGRAVSFTQATGSIVAERVIDGLFLTLATTLSLLVAAQVSPLPQKLGDLPLPLATLPAAVLLATLAFSGLFLAMVAFYFAREWSGRLIRRLVGSVSQRAAAWAERTLEHLAQGLSFLRSVRSLTSVAGHTALAWFLAFFAEWLLLRAAGLDASLPQAAAVIGILGLGVVVPAGPGLFGAFQIASFSALCLFFPLTAVRAQGTAIVFVMYVGFLVANLISLALGSLILALRSEPAAPAL